MIEKGIEQAPGITTHTPSFLYSVPVQPQAIDVITLASQPVTGWAEGRY